MGVSIDGEISYGIAFPEEFEFPWDEDEESEGDIDNWWLDVNGYKPPFELYDEEGGYIGGSRPPQEHFNACYEAERIFLTEHPLPVELVNVCSHEYPIYIVALKGTVITANRGFPQSFDPASLIVTDEQRNTLIEFCRTHNIDTGDAEPKWYLSSLWG
jgi:hypothetical protein